MSNAKSRKKYEKPISQADENCGFDFLETSAGAPVFEPEIH